MNPDEVERKFYVAYNEAYRLYLNSIHPIIFMNNFLERIIKITGSTSGYIASTHKISEKCLLNLEAFYKNKLNDDSVIYHNPLIDVNINNNSICMKALLTGDIHIANNTSIADVYDEPIRGFGCYTCYACIPYQFNRKTIGIIGLLKNSEYPMTLIPTFKILGNLIANLQNSYYKLKLFTTCDDKKFITYQLLDDILNTVHDGIIIIDTKFNVIHINSHANNLILELYDDLIKTMDTINLLTLFPQLKFLNDTTEKIFKNRKIEISIHDKCCEKNLEFIFNTVVCTGHFFHLVTIYTIQKKDDNNYNGKCLMAYLSHELRNPLQSISLANHLVKTKMKSLESQLPPKIMSYVDTINKSCQDMKKIINDILDLSRIDANELVIEMEACDVKELVDTVIDDNMYEADAKALQLLKNINKNTPQSVYTDSTRITQILNNLVSNGIKYSAGGKITLNVSYDEINNNIIFDVVDEGIGIKEDEINNLFKAYGKTSNNNKIKANSQGLGLCVSQKIAKLLGGNISVKSEMNIGSIFSFHHPVKLGMSSSRCDNDTIFYKLSGNVLLVDDNNSNLSLLHMLLDQFNYEYMWSIKIESVSNGRDAIELCKINYYDIIFMDINMSGIDGCTTSKIIKNNGFAGKIIATTGNILTKTENMEYEDCNFYKQFDDIIIKPFDDQTILKALKHFLIKNE